MAAPAVQEPHWNEHRDRDEIHPRSSDLASGHAAGTSVGRVAERAIASQSGVRACTLVTRSTGIA